MILPPLAAIVLGLSAVEAAFTYKGVDWSSVTVEEKAGVSYKTSNGNAQPLERILADSGVNTVRQRIWVNPSGGNYNLAYNIALAKRAKVAGLGVYLDLHYSDTWADPAHQSTPSGWPTGVDDLAWKLYNYTLDVANQFQSANVQPSIISIGNEITAGLLWPTGRTSSWGNIARLLHSASAGIKDSKLSPKPKIMIHLDNGWNWATQNNWYTNVLKQGTLVSSDFDMMGVSFYPFYSASATLANLKSSLTNMGNAWGKELVVAETDWPVSCPSPSQAFPDDTRGIPYTAAGQSTWMKNVASVVAGVKGGAGLFYWEPAWVHNANLGSSCANNCMFSNSGAALTSIDVFKSI
ncbi:family 53 glycosyl hydrolase [Podospora appendiculata]|uniref:Arabinogalactan endo-beta-1,4-galactanase n=1 Tax=Podospora appendiculata TaxID=314037 RepID=A0AAE0XI99_9PEZI|nr:family 53 glycosyl hydrolase [Podospora appendiculata]